MLERSGTWDKGKGLQLDREELKYMEQSKRAQQNHNFNWTGRN